MSNPYKYEELKICRVKQRDDEGNIEIHWAAEVGDWDEIASGETLSDLMSELQNYSE